MATYHVTTFGCQMNEHDSERMKGMLDSLGYQEVAERAAADLILFNTCSIRESADNRFVAHLGEAKRLKSEDPERVVGVGGCWAQSVKDEVFERFPFVDVAFGPGQIHRLAEFLTQDSLTAQGYFEFEDFSGHLPAKRRARVPGLGPDLGGLQLRLRLLHRSADARARGQSPARRADRGDRGAGRRGGSRGDPAGPEREQLRARPAEGASGSRSPSCWDAWTLSTGVERIRYTSPHPKDMREDVIRAHADLPALCEHIHLPLQSGSSRILKAMRRTYNRERYLDRVAQIREHVPDCALTTDIIVGFPGETDEDFAETLEVVDQVGYDGAFTFIFSPRRGTQAATMTGQVPHPVKRERMARLVELVQRRARERAQRFVGRTMEVLVEGPSRTDPARLRGRIAPQQDGQLRGHGRARRAGRGGDHRSHVDHALAGHERLLSRSPLKVLAIFGPTGVGKTAVAIATADRLRRARRGPGGGLV